MDFIIQLLSDPIGFYNSHTLLIAQIGINSIIATSMFVVLYSGQLSLAAPGFMAIGAYTSVLMDPVAALPPLSPDATALPDPAEVDAKWRRQKLREPAESYRANLSK